MAWTSRSFLHWKRRMRSAGRAALYHRCGCWVSPIPKTNQGITTLVNHDFRRHLSAYCLSSSISIRTTTTTTTTTVSLFPPILSGVRCVGSSSSLSPPSLSSVWDPCLDDTSVIFNGKHIGEISNIAELQAAVDYLEVSNEDLVKSDHWELIKPLLGVCKKLCEQHKVECATLAERILFYCLQKLPPSMQQRHELANSLVIPDVSDYNLVILICGSQRSLEGGQQAKRLVDLMWAEHREESHYVERINRQRCNAAASAKDNDNTQPIEEIRHLLPAPNMFTLHLLSRAWALSGTWEGALHAEAVLVQMEAWSGIRQQAMDNGITTAAATAAERMELEKQVQMEAWDGILEAIDNGDTDDEGEEEPENKDGRKTSFVALDVPQINCYNTVLSAYSRQGSHPQALERAKALFRHMTSLYFMKLDWFSYYPLLVCYRKSIKAGLGKVSMIKELEQILSEEFHQVTIPFNVAKQFAKEAKFPFSWAYGILAEAYLLQAGEERIQQAHDLCLAMTGDTFRTTLFPLTDEKNWPCHETLIQVYKAWRQSSAPHKLDQMNELREIACETFYARTIACNHDLILWRDSGLEDAAEIVDQIVSRMKLYPNRDTYKIRMETWLKSSRMDAPQIIERIIHGMSVGDITNIQMAVALESWLRLCPTGKRYEGHHGYLLPAQHVSQYLLRSNHWERWTGRVCQLALDAWARQKFPPNDDVDADKDGLLCLRQAVLLLNSIQHRSFRRNLPTSHYNSVLICCANLSQGTTKQRQEAYFVATDIYNRQKRKGPHRRNALSYVLLGQIAQAAAHVMADRYDVAKFAETFFLQARADGMVTQPLIWALLSLATSTMLQRLFLISPSEADKLVQMQKENGTRDWSNEEAASKLLIGNLPRNWSRYNQKGEIEE